MFHPRASVDLHPKSDLPPNGSLIDTHQSYHINTNLPAAYPPNQVLLVPRIRISNRSDQIGIGNAETAVAKDIDGIFVPIRAGVVAGCVELNYYSRLLMIVTGALLATDY